MNSLKILLTSIIKNFTGKSSLNPIITYGNGRTVILNMSDI